MKHHKSITWRISARISVLLVLALALVGGSSVSIFYHEVRLRVKDNARSEQKIFTKAITSMMSTVRSVGETTSALVSKELRDYRGDQEALRQIANDMTLSTRQVRACGICLDSFSMNRLGYEIASPFIYRDSVVEVGATQDTLDLFTQRDWYERQRLNNIGIWSDPDTDAESEATGLLAVTRQPITGPEGRKVGEVVVQISPRQLLTILRSVQLTAHSANVLLSLDGDKATMSDLRQGSGEEFMEKLKVKGYATWQQQMDTILSKGEGIFESSYDGHRGWCCYTHIKGTSWIALSFIPVQDMYQMSTVWKFIAVAWGTLALIILSVWTTSRYIRRKLRPLQEVSRAAVRVTEGDFTCPLPAMEDEDELSTLVSSFQTMRQSLVERIEHERQMATEQERIESELNIARTIQLSMVHPFPEHVNDSCFAAMHPAREVGGDLYHYMHEKDRLYFAIGDVSGKGVPSAIIMSQLVSLLQSAELTSARPLDIMMEMLNRLACKNNAFSMFCTMLLCRMDYQSGVFSSCNAGHNPPVLIPPGGEPRFYETDTNLPLGIRDKQRYTVQELPLEHGSTLFLYTDGVTEATNSRLELYGEQRLLQALQGTQHLSPTDICDRVRTDIAAFVGDAPQSDDITMFVVRY